MERERQERDRQSHDNIVSATARWLWRFFSSIRLAVVLIIVLTVLSLIGALLVQVPPGIVRGSQQYDLWLEYVSQTQLGALATPLSFLGLLDVFHSFWFVTAGLMLVANIIVCSLNRWRSIRISIAGGSSKRAASLFSGGKNTAVVTRVPGQPAQLLPAAAALLGRYHYRVSSETGVDRVYLAADKNRYSPLGSYLSHLSLILFIVAFLAGSYFGFRNPAFIVPEGTQRDVGYGTGLSLRLDSFEDEYWPDGAPKDYRSQVALYLDGQEVQRGVVRVNHPMEYRGVRFFQSSFGPAVVLQVKNDQGVLLYNDALPLTNVRTTGEYQRPEGGFGLAGADVMIYIVGSARNLDDPVIGEDQVGLEVYTMDSETPFSIKLQKGEPATLEGLEFTLVNQVRWTGLEVSRDPGNMLIWLASALFLLGLGIVFYLPGSQVYLMLQRLPKGGSQLLFYSLPNRHPGVNAQIRSLSQELQNELTRGETKEKN